MYEASKRQAKSVSKGAQETPRGQRQSRRIDAFVQGQARLTRHRSLQWVDGVVGGIVINKRTGRPASR